MHFNTVEYSNPKVVELLKNVSYEWTNFQDVRKLRASKVDIHSQVNRTVIAHSIVNNRRRLGSMDLVIYSVFTIS